MTTWNYISPELVAEIKEYLKEDDLTVAEFVELINSNKGTYYAIMSDSKPMMVSHAVKISQVTGIDYNYILENTAFSQYAKKGGMSVTQNYIN